MLFLSYWFVVFAALFFPTYWALPPRLRSVVVLAASIVFHGHFAGSAGVAPIVVIGATTFLAGRSGRSAARHVAIALVVATLVLYKYAPFLLEELVGLIAPDLGRTLAEHARAAIPATPPLAISFFAFEFVHYLVEVDRGREPIRSPRDFIIFALYWPSIVAGPIKRYQQFIPELEAGAVGVRLPDVATGGLRVALGLSKKVVADNLTAWIAFQDDRLHLLPPATRWAFLAALALRIVLDFGGYSDMAIGFARMQGVRLQENFDWPYLARSPADFWRRWHMSLSTWIRDYVYIPLGGGRAGTARKIANGLVAFLLCGLWHGAAWNFAVWGLYHGAGLALVTAVGSLGAFGARAAAFFERAWLLSWGMTTLFVAFGWLFFFYPVGEALRLLRLIVGGDV